MNKIIPPFNVIIYGKNTHANYSNMNGMYMQKLLEVIKEDKIILAGMIYKAE